MARKKGFLFLLHVNKGSCFRSDGANLTMANIEEEEEDETVVIEIEPPKRKAIATLKVGDIAVTDSFYRPVCTDISSRRTLNLT